MLINGRSPQTPASARRTVVAPQTCALQVLLRSHGVGSLAMGHAIGDLGVGSLAGSRCTRGLLGLWTAIGLRESSIAFRMHASVQMRTARRFEPR
jgi:hypothetical protein